MRVVKYSGMTINCVYVNQTKAYYRLPKLVDLDVKYWINPPISNSERRGGQEMLETIDSSSLVIHGTITSGIPSSIYLNLSLIIKT